MAKRGRPRGATSGKRPTPYWCAWGTPNHVTSHAYADEGGARGKALAELGNMRKFADKYAHDFRDQIDAAVLEVRSAAYTSATREHPREWRATDDTSQLTFVVRLWKE